MSDMAEKQQKVNEAPLSETIIPKRGEGSREEFIEDLRAMAIANPEQVISRNYYRVHGTFAESVWSQYFGTWNEAKRQAGIVLSRQQHHLEKQIAKHASIDHYRVMNEERAGYADLYTRENKRRFQSAIICSDLHDKMIDPFFLRVLIDTTRRVQPEIVCYAGDVFDLPEFGKYTIDPREWDVVGRIEFVHDNIFAPMREAAPDAQHDLLEGNHENRLLRHLGDSTPAMKVLLSDLHGMTIANLLGLERFEINYIAPADLAAYSLKDIRSELAKNHRIYWKSVLVHHFPEGRNMGLPGVNGHHHKHVVWSGFNPVYGAYEWHQLGSGHRRDASYTNGEKWSNGFIIANVDTQTRAVCFDYVDVRDFAVSGGKFYYRAKNERVVPLPAAL